MGGADRVERREEGKDVGDMKAPGPVLLRPETQNMKLLCSPFWPCNTLSGGMVAPVPCVDGTH